LTLSKAGELQVPTLVLISGEDVIVDPQASEEFGALVPKEHLTKHRYEGFRHEILNETPERREKVLADIERWFIQQEANR